MRTVIVTATLIVEDHATPARVSEYLRTNLILPADANPIKMVSALVATDVDPRAATRDTPPVPR